MNEVAMDDALSAKMGQDVRAVRFRFLDAVESHRPALYRYCRSLTRTVWDAEDLSQDTLLKAFARLGQVHFELKNPRSYLFRIATRTWIDRQRKHRPDALPEGLDPSSHDENSLTPEVREALETLARHLPPQERVAVLLKDVYGLSLQETAATLLTTVGAVKAALHRGRKKLGELRDTPSPVEANAREVSADLLDRFVAAFNAHDLAGLTALFREDAEAQVVGMVHEIGRQQIRDGSLEHTLFDPQGTPRAERATYAGEPCVLLWYETPTGERLGDVLRFVTGDDAIARLRYYYYCPELLEEVGAALGHTVATNGYRYTPGK